MELAYLDPASSGIIVSAVVAGFGSLGVAWRSLKMRMTGAGRADLADAAEDTDHMASGEGEAADAEENTVSKPSAK